MKSDLSAKCRWRGTEQIREGSYADAAAFCLPAEVQRKRMRSLAVAEQVTVRPRFDQQPQSLSTVSSNAGEAAVSARPSAFYYFEAKPLPIRPSAKGILLSVRVCQHF